MAEGCTISHADSRRSLPSWMLKTCSSNEVSKTEDGNQQASEPDKQPGALDRIKPIKKKSKRCLKSVDKEDHCERGTLQRCQGKKKVSWRKSKDAHAVEDEYEEIEKVTSENVQKASGRAALENFRKRKLKNIDVEASSPGSTDNEVELTVEDLVSIANEIVNADKEKQQEVQAMKAVRFPRYEEYPPCPPIPITGDTRGSVLNDRSMKGLLPCTTTIADTISTAVDTGGPESNGRPTKGLLQCTTASTNTATSECGVEKHRGDELQCSTSVKMTEDVAQDMLNIFLGPLWSKPPAYKRKSDAIESITVNVDHTSETRNLHSEVQRQGVPLTKTKSSLKDKLLETKNLHNEVRRQEAPVTKKKSSLKDKVALFL